MRSHQHRIIDDTLISFEGGNHDQYPRHSPLTEQFPRREEVPRGAVSGIIRIYHDTKNPNGHFYAVVPVQLDGSRSESSLVVEGLNGPGIRKATKKIRNYLTLRGIEMGNLSRSIDLEVHEVQGKLLQERASRSEDTYWPRRRH